jgi:hypothetical protein
MSPLILMFTACLRHLPSQAVPSLSRGDATLRLHLSPEPLILGAPTDGALRPIPPWLHAAPDLIDPPTSSSFDALVLNGMFYLDRRFTPSPTVSGAYRDLGVPVPGRATTQVVARALEPRGGVGLSDRDTEWLRMQYCAEGYGGVVTAVYEAQDLVVGATGRASVARRKLAGLRVTSGLVVHVGSNAAGGSWPVAYVAVRCGSALPPALEPTAGLCATWRGLRRQERRSPKVRRPRAGPTMSSGAVDPVEQLFDLWDQECSPSRS